MSRATLIFILTMMLPPFAEAKVLGKDGRKRPPANYSNLESSIGKLVDRTNNFVCTAFCVARNTIVTNAHCLAWGVNKKYQKTRDLRNFVFRLTGRSTNLRWKNAKPLGDPYLSALVPKPKKKWSASNYVDWAAARLWDGICGENALRFADARLINKIESPGGVKVSMIGYHADRFKRHIAYQDCHVAGTSYGHGNAIAGHTCDTGRWSSGSPLLVRTDEGVRVIAIHRGNKSFKKAVSLAFGSSRKQRWKVLNIAVLPIQLKRELPEFLDKKF
ncbi:MAG: trypsin-like peptidase domain-containing protein [Pseudomonadota bacterium]